MGLATAKLIEEYNQKCKCAAARAWHVQPPHCMWYILWPNRKSHTHIILIAVNAYAYIEHISSSSHPYKSRL